MSTNQFKITGRVIDSHTGVGLPDIHLELWDKDLIFDYLLGSADTDADGRFSLTFNETYFRELIERRPGKGVKFLTSSSDETRWLLEPKRGNHVKRRKNL